MMYSECAEVAAVSCGTSHSKYATSVKKRTIKSYSLMYNHMQAQ